MRQTCNHKALCVPASFQNSGLPSCVWYFNVSLVLALIEESNLQRVNEDADKECTYQADVTFDLSYPPT